MSDAIESNLWKRLRHTPLRDLAPGRISGRLDIKGRIESAGLPAAVQSLILRLIKRTRLWRLEKIDVADELIVHFLDGLESGATAGQLIQSFGDEKQAAALIRRAMKRNRPLAWQVARALGWMLAVFFTYYVICVALMFLGRPSIRTDYLALINRTPLSAPPEQRAWPIYRKVLLDLWANEHKDAPGAFSPFESGEPDYQIGQARWPEMMRWLNDHQSLIKQIRQGAAMPVFGFVYGPNGSVADPQVFPTLQSSPKFKSDQPLIMVQIPALNMGRGLAQLVMADARLARAQNDSKRCIDDAKALLGMADQLNNQAFLVGDFVSLDIRGMAITTIDRAIAGHAAMFDQSQLQELAHLLARPQRADELMHFGVERWGFYDLVQRIYTDNGRDDGRLTWEGISVIRSAAAPATHTSDRISNMELLLGATSPLVAASRRDVTGVYDHFLDIAEANLHKPLREVNWNSYYDQVNAFDDVPLNSVRFVLIRIMVPALGNCQLQAEKWLGERDGLVAGIALEVYRRQHGAYPESLEQLAPALLPTVPQDRVTGDPLRYRLIDGKPVVYSVGTNRKDDGGRPPKYKRSAWEIRQKTPASDGDWILYPQPVEADGERK